MPTRLIDSTPPPMVMSCCPDITWAEAKLIASRPEAQKRLICTPPPVLPETAGPPAPRPASPPPPPPRAPPPPPPRRPGRRSRAPHHRPRMDRRDYDP